MHLDLSKLLVVCSLALAACGNPTVNVNTGAAANMERSVAMGVKQYATSTPPAGARSMGPQTSPTVKGVTIPITNADVYVFQANVDDDPAMETLYWAASGAVIYVWGDIDLACVDDGGAATGETGVADFIMEADSAGYGWMVATDACGYSTLFGCSAETGQGETCGGCDFNNDFVVCVAS